MRKQKTPEQEHDEFFEKMEAEGTEAETPAPARIPQSTSDLCPNCKVTFMLDDGICPACNPRVIAPGPTPDGN